MTSSLDREVLQRPMRYLMGEMSTAVRDDRHRPTSGLCRWRPQVHHAPVSTAAAPAGRPWTATV